MERVRLTVDVTPDLRRRVRIAAASEDRSVKEFVERALERALSAVAGAEGGGRTAEDDAWLEGDVSRLGEIEPYEWAEGELEEGEPVVHERGRGFVRRPGP